MDDIANCLAKGKNCLMVPKKTSVLDILNSNNQVSKFEGLNEHPNLMLFKPSHFIIHNENVRKFDDPTVNHVRT